MELNDWAEDHAQQLLSPLGPRWRHAQGVAEAAQKLANGLTRMDGIVLVASAYLHDIGYAKELVITGFHPVDGARHLRGLGHERLAELVAHHTRARHEAGIRGLESALARFNDENSLVSAALAYCDLTTGPSGERMSPEQRLADVVARYGERSPVTRGLRTAWPELMEDVQRVETLRRQHAARSMVVQPK